MIATIKETHKKYICCPECGEPTSTYNHLNPGSTFGPWYCGECGCGFHGTILDGGAVEITLASDRKYNTLVLLRLDAAVEKPICIVVEGMKFAPTGTPPEYVLADVAENDGYFYNEHTCPWNYLRIPIMEGENTDPHGIFVHQETVMKPTDYDGHISRSVEAWRELFPSLRGE